MLKGVEFHSVCLQGHIPCQDLCKMHVSRAHIYCNEPSPNLQRQRRRCLMCSVKFASHCPSKHVNILLYFLTHEFNTHSSTVPKYITLGFPDTEIFQKLFLEQFLAKVVILASLALNVVFFLQAICYKCFLQVWIKIELSQIKVMYSLVDIYVIRGTQFIMKSNLQNAFNPVIQYLYLVY